MCVSLCLYGFLELFLWLIFLFGSFVLLQSVCFILVCFIIIPLVAFYFPGERVKVLIQMAGKVGRNWEK